VLTAGLVDAHTPIVTENPTRAPALDSLPR
jgi:hypothetical protein